MVTVNQDREESKEVPKAPEGSGAIVVLMECDNDTQVELFTSIEAADKWIVEFITELDECGNAIIEDIAGGDDEFLQDFYSAMDNNEKVCLYLQYLYDQPDISDFPDFNVFGREVQRLKENPGP